MAPSSRNKRNEDGEEYTGIEERINHQRTNPKSSPDIQSHVADSHSGSAVDNEDSSDDDDIGPQLYTQPVARPPVTRSDNELDSQGTLKGDIPVKRRRDDWMVLPPDKGSPSSDRLKLRNRKFNTSKDATVTRNPGDFTPWTESHEQKKRRLENEILGIQPPSEGQRGNPVAGTPKSNEAMAERVKLSNVRNHRTPDLIFV